MLHFIPSGVNDQKTFVLNHSLIDSADNDTVFIVFGRKDLLIDESMMLTGLYDVTQKFFRFVLPELRTTIMNFIGAHTADHYHESDEGLTIEPNATVYLGSEIGTLYTAYYLAVSGIPFFLNIASANALGGESEWSKTHPLMLNKVLMIILSCAQEVYVADAAGIEDLNLAFPRVHRSYQDMSVAKATDALRYD